jgi:hypothetical protein
MQQRLKTSFQSGCWLVAVGRVTLLRVNLTFHLSFDIFSLAEEVGNVILVRFKWAAVGLKK